MPNGGIQVNLSHVDGLALTTVRGELDLASADELNAVLDNVASEEPVILDLSAVEFMDSSGLAVLLRQSMRRREAGGALHIRQPSAPVLRLLEFCCLEHLLEPERAAAPPRRRRAFRRPKV